MARFTRGGGGGGRYLGNLRKAGGAFGSSGEYSGTLGKSGISQPQPTMSPELPTLHNNHLQPANLRVGKHGRTESHSTTPKKKLKATKANNSKIQDPKPKRVEPYLEALLTISRVTDRGFLGIRSRRTKSQELPSIINQRPRHPEP